MLSIGLLLLLLSHLASLFGALLQTDCALTPVVTVVELAPEIPEQPSHSQVKHTFYTTKVVVTYQAGQQVKLISAVDGSRDIVADDFAHLSAWPSGQIWQHDFRSGDRTKVLPIPAQDITHLFVPGENHLEFFTQDLTPPVFSSRPFFLVFIGACVTPTVTPPPAPIPTATFTPWPTATPTMTPSATATFTPTPWPTATSTSTPPATSTQTPVPTATTNPTATPTDPQAGGFLPVVGTASLVDNPSVPPSGWLRGRTWLPLSIALVVGSALWWVKTRRQNKHAGTVSIYEGNKWIRTVDLAMLHKQEASLGREGNMRLERDPHPLGVSARLRNHWVVDGQPTVLLEYLAAPPATAGSGTLALQKPIVVQTQILQHGDAFSIGPYRLIYKHFG